MRGSISKVSAEARGAEANKSTALLAILLFAVTFAAYHPVWNGKPIWDDDAHLTRSSLRTLHGLERIWIEPGATQQYYPLIHSLFWIEHVLWGDAPIGYHLVNIFLHAVSALLVMLIMRRLQIPGAWFAAFLFALHPVEVESVAWISELKNILSGVFYLSALRLYLDFDQMRNRKLYAAALALFILGLLSKTVVATLPAALLVIFWWKRGRLLLKRDVFPLVPFFAAGISAGLFTAWVERTFVIGADGSQLRFGLVERFLIAGRALWFYLGKLFWPKPLIFIYPHWDVSSRVWWQYLFPFAALLLFAVAWRIRGSSRAPLAGLLYFAGTLFPALGFINVYPFIYSFVADHFQYLAGLGIIVPVSAAAAGLARKWPSWGSITCVVILTTLAGLTWRQSAIYTSPETLYRTTIARNPGCWMAYNNLGVSLVQEGHVDEALASFLQSLRIRPDNRLAEENAGLALEKKGRLDEALAHLQKIVELQPGFTSVHTNLGDVLFKMGRRQDAIAEYEKALAIEPRNSLAQGNLGYALLQENRPREAIIHLETALLIDSENAEFHSDLGAAFERIGSLGPARQEYERALKLRPEDSGYSNNLAWILATSPTASAGERAQAVALAQRASQLTGGNSPEVLDTLAAAFAQNGRFEDATKTAEQAAALASAGGNTAFAARIRQRIALYRTGVPARAPLPANAAPENTQP